MTFFIQSLRYPGWPATSAEVNELLGLKPKQKLPAEGMDGQYIQGIDVWVLPLPPRPAHVHHKRSKHRVVAACPGCGRQLSVGRLRQHRCK